MERFRSCLDDGTAVGAVRASFGLANNAADVERAIAVIARFRT
jgi:selenocysteine lyase/cysteine desulfurase